MKTRKLELALPLAYGGPLWIRLLHTVTGAAHQGPLLFVLPSYLVEMRVSALLARDAQDRAIHSVMRTRPRHRHQSKTS
jgi:hypothetical protein